MGNGSVIRPGNVQRMSAGTGVLHSEFNPPDRESSFPADMVSAHADRIDAGYEEKYLSDEENRVRLRLIASPDSADGPVTIHPEREGLGAAGRRRTG